MGVVTARALPGLPEIGPGCDLAALIVESEATLADGDVVVIAQKAVSKAEGRIVELDQVSPGARAVALAHEHGHDPRAVQVVLDESLALVRAARGVLICRTHHGFVCANAGVDSSNLAGEGLVLTLPADPDASARAIRARLRELGGCAPAVLISDSFGRAWRHGQCDVAIGAAGLGPLDDWRDRRDRGGRQLRATWIAIADEAASAADLARAKDSGDPVVVVSGLDRHVTREDGPGAAAIIRPLEEDLFR